MLSRLQEIVGDDRDMYEPMSRLLFLDPRKITTSIEDAAGQASAFEEAGNNIRAEVWYRIAGGMALYKGDVDAVRKFFEKAFSLAGNTRREYKIAADRSEAAVKIAKKYYETT